MLAEVEVDLSIVTTCMRLFGVDAHIKSQPDAATRGRLRAETR